MTHTKWFLSAFYLLAVLSGINSALMPGTATDLILSFAVAISMGCWAVVDARLRDRPTPMSARAWFVLLAWFVVPLYVIWSRGWRGLGWVLAHGACWFLLATIAMNVVGFSVFGEDWGR